MKLDADLTRVRVVDVAGSLFYSRGVQGVGMDEIRSAAGVSLKRLYQLYAAKDQLVGAVLRRCGERWRARLVKYADAQPAGDQRVLAVFDWLHLWFGEPDFRGCAFVNIFGELSSTHPEVATITRAHKAMFGLYMTELVTATGRPAALATQVALLAEGAITTAAISGSADAALHARAAAKALLAAVPPGSEPLTPP
jgi:AcrR family transcriptional regulator